MRGVQAAFALGRAGQYGANSVLPEGPDPLMHPEAAGGYPPGMGGMPPGMGAPYMPRPPSMPRRAHFANDVEQPLSPANVKRQGRLAPMAQSPLMRQASMAGNGQVPPWFANAMGGQALRSPTMPAPRRGPSDWSRDLAPQSGHSGHMDGEAAAASVSVNQSLNVESLPTESFGLSQPAAAPPGAMASPPTSPPTQDFGLAQPAEAPPGAMASPPTSPPPPRGQLPSLDTAALSPRGLPPLAVPESPFASNPGLFGASTSKTVSSGEEAEKTFSSGEERDEIL